MDVSAALPLSVNSDERFIATHCYKSGCNCRLSLLYSRTKREENTRRVSQALKIL